MAIPFFKREPDNEIPPIPTAIVERSNGMLELSDLYKKRLKIIEDAGIHAGKWVEEHQDLQIKLTEAMLKLESANRAIGEMQVQLAQRDNNYQVLQTHSDQRIRAIQAQSDARLEQLLRLEMILSNICALLEKRNPPQQLWQSANEVNHASPLGTIDRPAGGADQGAGSADPAA